MNVANLENCKRLYEASGWDDTYMQWMEFTGVITEPLLVNPTDIHNPKLQSGEVLYPAYDCGYLLRKLPEVELYDAINCWQAQSRKIEGWRTVQDTPEDALCLLAIKLFEEGILTKEEDK